MDCSWCGEDVADPKRWITDGSTGERLAVHDECLVRQVMGSVGHQRGLCQCHGGDFDDPPGMTKHEAALAALEEFKMSRGPASSEYDDLFVGEVWRSRRGVERRIVDLVHEGYEPDNPQDMGSFEEWNVHYRDGAGRMQVEAEFRFRDWIKNAGAVLVEAPEDKVGFRDE